MGHTRAELVAQCGTFGSSPHTWGILIRFFLPFLESRFIPTYVGHTAMALSRASRSYGSSPHTWGIRIIKRINDDIPRFIPTYVGHTIPPETRPRANAVHPHIRGAYNPAVLDGGFAIGSSPHTWGIRVDFFGVAGNARFIPTYVGHTHSSDVYRPFRSVHPHIRGAYSCCPPVVWVFPGSSPHTWGILKRLQQFREHRRFIPTYVGHTSPILHCSPHTTVHPHIRGAYGLIYSGHKPSHGSSPHTWGILWPNSTQPRYQAVHPHIRGAYFCLLRRRPGR